MKLCPECLGRGFVYSPGGYAPKLPCPICRPDSVPVAESAGGDPRPTTASTVGPQPLPAPELERESIDRERLIDIATLHVLRYEADMRGNNTVEDVAFNLRYRDDPHSGDCTKMPWTCMRCVVDDARRQSTDIVDAILAALPRMGVETAARVIAPAAWEEIDGHRFAIEALTGGAMPALCAELRHPHEVAIRELSADSLTKAATILGGRTDV